MNSTFKILRNGAITLLIVGAMPLVALAQATTTDDTAVSVAAGQQIWQQLQAKQVSCSNLSDANFENLGEYFMNQMMGNSHESMNVYVVSRFGQSGEEQMHITMGTRLSGCDPQAAYPSWMQGFMPMMSGNGGYGMMGSGSNYYGSNYTNSMMGYGYGSMMSGGLFSGVLWIVALVDLVLVGIWLWRQISK